MSYILESKNPKYGKTALPHLKSFNKDCAIYNFPPKYLSIGMHDRIYIFTVKIAFNQISLMTE